MFIKIFPPKDPEVYMLEANSYIYEWSEVESLEFIENGHHYIYIPFYAEDDQLTADYVGKLALQQGKDPLTN